MLGEFISDGLKKNPRQGGGIFLKNMADKLKISFHGACQEVTGSNYLLEYAGQKILIDCGFFQGSKINDDRNEEPFAYNPADISALIVTHAHLDHIGRIPKLVHSGFKGKIFSTGPTKELSALMLIDSLGVLEKEKKGELIYTEDDVRSALALWQSIEYHKEVTIGPFKIILKDAGHILGSAMAEIEINKKKILFTGDLGNSPEPLLNDTEKIIGADYMVVESTYGDRLHEPKEEANIRLERIIEDTLNKGGTLMIPAFSLERSQMIIFKVHELMDNGRIPKVPVFLDSPLSINATKIYSQYLKEKGDIFNFPNLKKTLTSEESKKINAVAGPKIIIAGSGMCNGGRILHHLVRYLPKADSTLLLVSYQTAGSLGRQLSDGAKMVNILGEKVLVAARVEMIEGFSSHPDRNMLYNFVADSADKLKKVFATHGELKANLFFVQRLRDSLGLDAVSPKLGQLFEIEI